MFNRKYYLEDKQEGGKSLSHKIDYKIITCKTPIKNHYTFEKELLGRGSFGEVYQAMNKQTRVKVAIKSVDKKEHNDQLSQMMSELVIF